MTLSLYSEVLGTNVDLGRYMGLMLGVGAIPRAIGPFVSMSVLDYTIGDDGRYRTGLEFGINLSLFLLAIFVYAMVWKRVVPYDDYVAKFVDVNVGGGVGGRDFKALKERRSSFRPSIVSVVKGEFPSNPDLLTGLSEESKRELRGGIEVDGGMEGVEGNDVLGEGTDIGYGAV